MKFMVSLITDGTAMEGMPPEQMADFGRRMGEFMEEIRSAGVLVNTGRLGPVAEARTARPGSGSPVVTDGPFAETKEQIGGYMVLECGGARPGRRLGRAHAHHWRGPRGAPDHRLRRSILRRKR